LPPQPISPLDWQRPPPGIAPGAVLVAVLTCSAPALACPSCAPGLQARAEVWSDGFLRNLATAALPFVVVGAVCARLQKVGRRP